MASFSFIIGLLSLLVVAPQLCAIKVSEPREITLFGLPTLDMTIDLDLANLNANEDFWGPVLHAIEVALTLQSWVIDPPLVTRPTLGHQARKKDRPPGLIQLTFLGADGNSAKAVFRKDNLYLCGFANRFGQYFVLQGYKHVMPGATLLPLADDYEQLLGRDGLRGQRDNLPLGKTPFAEAVNILGNNLNNNIDKQQLGRALATIIVMIPESLRITPVQELVTQAWADGQVVNLQYLEVEYILDWGRMSALIMCLSRGEPLRGKRANRLVEINMLTKEQALVVINIMLWPITFDESNLFESCGDPPKRQNPLP